jgi:hypothetical protein
MMRTKSKQPFICDFCGQLIKVSDASKNVPGVCKKCEITQGLRRGK